MSQHESVCCHVVLQAILESVEAQLPQQLHSVPTDLLASGLWAMARLQLQPQPQLVAAVAQHLLEQPQHCKQQQQAPPTAAGAGHDHPNSRNRRSYSIDVAQFRAVALSTRLAGCSTRSLGTFCYSLNFFLIRDPRFWATAAAVSLQHLQQLKPSNISNLLQGLALSGWVLNPGALGPQQVSSSRLGEEHPAAGSTAAAGATPQQSQQQHWQHESLGQYTTAAAAADATPGGTVTDFVSNSNAATAASVGGADAVLQLLRALESSLLKYPSRLRLWRLRDISQLVQAYSLIGYRCGPLFAVLAQHLLEGTEPLHEQTRLRQAAAQQQQQQQLLQQEQQQEARVSQQHQQQQQRPSWNAPPSSISVLSAAYPSTSRSGPESRFSSNLSWHDKGRGIDRLAQCTAGDAVGIAWAYVHSFCPNQLLLYELAAVLTTKAADLHAADVSRLLWAYATAKVVDNRMLAAVTAAVCEEMHGVLPRTAAGAVRALAMMRYEAPAFMEAAFDRLAACLEATPPAPAAAAAAPVGADPVRQVYYSTTAAAAAASASAAGGGQTVGLLQAVAGLGSAAAAAAGGSAAAAAAAVEHPSILQQLITDADRPAWLSGGPQVGCFFES